MQEDRGRQQAGHQDHREAEQRGPRQPAADHVAEARNDRVKQGGNVAAPNVAPRHRAPRHVIPRRVGRRSTLIRHGASLADVRYWYG